MTRYLIRFDDICPTMNWATWEILESFLLQHRIKPILAVVPENLDPGLMVDPPREDFWHQVRKWQALGWSIALHGYQHVYVNKNAGLMGLTPQSEFAGLSYQEQAMKISKGLDIFASHGIRADAWVAPSHSFDQVTLSVLRDMGIRTVSDGLAFRPFRDSHGMTWVPQQFANLRPMPFGVWTCCYHANHFSPASLSRFIRKIERMHSRIISLEEAARMGQRPKTRADSLVEVVRHFVSHVRHLNFQ